MLGNATHRAEEKQGGELLKNSKSDISKRMWSTGSNAGEKRLRCENCPLPMKRPVVKEHSSGIKQEVLKVESLGLLM